MRYGLNSNTINKLKSVFIQYPQVDEVILYGSRAMGNFESGSDIDLTIIGQEIDLPELNKIENAMDNLLLPYVIDLSIHDHIKSESLLDHIKRRGINFFTKTKTGN